MDNKIDQKFIKKAQDISSEELEEVSGGSNPDLMNSTAEFYDLKCGNEKIQNERGESERRKKRK